jgi:antitoxin (DNA-binding transcriptional repressor) of toxin-antitoxin stability system
MEDVSLTHAKDHLEELIERAAKGEEIRISDPEFGIVRLQPVAGSTDQERKPRPERRPGRWKGRFTVPERLFEPLSDEEQVFARTEAQLRRKV